jgi:hypothetical protein
MLFSLAHKLFTLENKSLALAQINTSFSKRTSFDYTESERGKRVYRVPGKCQG